MEIYSVQDLENYFNSISSQLGSEQIGSSNYIKISNKQNFKLKLVYHTNYVAISICNILDGIARDSTEIFLMKLSNQSQPAPCTDPIIVQLKRFMELYT